MILSSQIFPFWQPGEAKSWYLLSVNYVSGFWTLNPHPLYFIQAVCLMTSLLLGVLWQYNRLILLPTSVKWLVMHWWCALEITMASHKYFSLLWLGLQLDIMDQDQKQSRLDKPIFPGEFLPGVVDQWPRTLPTRVAGPPPTQVFKKETPDSMHV